MRDVQFVVFTVLVTVRPPVCAYIDPGTGSAIVSLIIGFFVALGLTFKTYLYKLKALLTRLTRSGGNPDPEPEKPEDDGSNPFHDQPDHQ